MALLIARCVGGLGTSAGGDSDIAPWSLPDTTTNMGSGAGWLLLGWRFRVTSGGIGTMEITGPGATYSGDYPGVYHADEPTASFTGTAFSVLATNGSATGGMVYSGLAEDTWFTLNANRAFGWENTGSGTYTVSMTFKIRRNSDSQIMAQGDFSLTGTRT